MRQEVLKNEYETNVVFTSFESRLRKLLSGVQDLNVVDFFYERTSIDYQIKVLTSELSETFPPYTPSHKIYPLDVGQTKE